MRSQQSVAVRGQNEVETDAAVLQPIEKAIPCYWLLGKTKADRKQA